MTYDCLSQILKTGIDPRAVTDRLNRLDAGGWQRLCDIAARHKILPFLYSRISESYLDIVPPEFFQKLKDMYIINLKENLGLENEMFRIMSVMKESGIVVMPIKGPAFGNVLYGDVGLRQISADLDFIVHAADCDAAGSVIMSVGYPVKGRREIERDFLHPSAMVPKRHFSFHADGRGSAYKSVELHTYIRGFFTEEDMDDIWERSGPVPVGDRYIPLMAKEDALIYLSLISITPLEFVQLKYVLDIHMLVSGFGRVIDWDAVADHTDRYGLRPSLYFALLLSRDVFRTDVGRDIIGMLRPGNIPVGLISRYINEQCIFKAPKGIRDKLIVGFLMRRYIYSRSLAEFVGKAVKKTGVLCHSMLNRQN
ncbi:MAG: nucleotidyltransferase family protein [Candidatus Omnitrophota bacterium]